MEKGYLSFVLHAHLPFVRHPEHEHFLEEDWFFEAITETYIPLCGVFENLIRDGVPFRITVSISPTLMAMMTDTLLQDRYIRYLDNLIELSTKEVQRTRWEPDFHRLAEFYRQYYTDAKAAFAGRYQRNLLNPFREFQEAGRVELITCGATHGYMPLMDGRCESMAGQVRIAAQQYERHFGRKPPGFWYPECGYVPGSDKYLREQGIRYFFTDTHGILYATPRPKYGVFAPVYCPSGVAAFGRDIESSKQVWSAIEGYPGDYEYREFYRDIGYDLDLDYLRPHLVHGFRTNTGIKYYQITGRTADKKPYNPDRAREKSADHAGNFVFNRGKQIEYLAGVLDRKPIIVAPYDAELFGHWWFEGPMWLEYVIRKMAYDQDTVRLAAPSDYLNENPRNQVATPSLSSWGYQGYSEVWLNASNDWVYRHLNQAAERMVELARRYETPSETERRALNQAARELLLAQASDWAFIMKTGTMTEYAIRRTKEHVGRFTRLYTDLLSGQIDAEWLRAVEETDNLFPDIDYRVYAAA